MTEIDAERLLHDLLGRARASGADAADASLSIREGLSVDVRLGALEGVEREETRSIALRAFVGKRQAAAVSTDLSEPGLDRLAQRVAAMARTAPEDPHCGLLDPRWRAGETADLALNDPARPDVATLERLAAEAEAAALAAPGVTNSSGAGASWDAGLGAYATHDGFYRASRSASFSLGVAPLAERDGQKERDYEGRTRRRFADLPDPAQLGARAGERAAARLGARKLDSRTAAVVFENRVAPRLFGPLLGAISGPAIARGVSFLKGKLGERVFPEGFTLLEDPHRPGGLASRAFDGEGGETRVRALVEDGRLTSWLLNAASARQLGLEPTGHATFGHGGPPGVGAANVIAPTRAVGGLAGLLQEAQSGLLVTEMFSPALNANTGDWSVGVAGFWFEDGTVAYPVSEVTVAGTLTEIYARLHVGDDVEPRGAIETPSLLVDALKIGGR